MSIESIIDTIGYYKIAIIAFTILIFTVIVHLKGTKNNLALVKEYMKSISPVFAKYFPQFQQKIIQQTSNVLKVYAEGRKSCIFAIIGFAVDMSIFRWYLVNRFQKERLTSDRSMFIVIQIPIRSDNPPLFSCAIFKRTYLKNITKKKYPDLKKYCSEHQNSNLPKNLMMIIQNNGLLNLILNDKTLPIWTQNSNCLKIFYMSDSNKLSKYGFCVRLVVELKQKGMENLPELIEMVIQIVDKLSVTKMSESTKSHIQKKRNQADN